MRDKRPIFLNLCAMRFPVTAIASILHRVSGVVLFLFIPFALWVLQSSLHSAEQFDALQNVMKKPLCKLTFFLFLVALVYHLLAGVRHLVMDCGHAESFKAARASAIVVMLLTVTLAVVIGVCLW